jgi:hypothetical protein
MQNVLKIKIYENIILLVVLCWCVTWCLTLREANRLRVFENRVVRKIFGPKGNEVIRGCKKMHNKELHNLYYSSNIIRMIKPRRMRWAERIASRGKKSNA